MLIYATLPTIGSLWFGRYARAAFSLTVALISLAIMLVAMRRSGQFDESTSS